MDLLLSVRKTLHPNIAAQFENDVAFLRTSKPYHGDLLSKVAQIAYLLGQNAIAVEFFTLAFTHGFPPEGNEDRTDPASLAFKRALEGKAALDFAIAAYLAGDPEKYTEILNWTVERFADIDAAFGGKPGFDAPFILFRAYADLIVGNRTPRVRADLAFAKAHIGGYGLRHLPPLTHTLISLNKVLSGEVDRAEAAGRLAWFVGTTEKAFKPPAVFHALFLQDRFPEAFDPVLPPLRPNKDIGQD